MSAYVTANRAVQAIRNITAETGFPPTPEELAEALDVGIQSLHSTLLPAKRSGQVSYDADGRFVVSEDFA